MRRPPPISDIPFYPITGGTILLAVGVTAAWKIGNVDVSALMENALIRRGEVWRLLTSVLPHVDVFHLVFNLYWTWVFGTLIERVFGHFKTFAIFCLLALVSNSAEYALLAGGVGLSGVGYGLFGMIWVLSSRDSRFADAVDRNTVWTFVGWFFFCLVLTYTGTPIANIAHAAGAGMGALLGWTLCASKTRRVVLSLANALVLIVAVLTVMFGRSYVNFSHDGSDEDHLGYVALTADKNQEAVEWFEEATRLNPRDSTGWYDLGIAYRRVNNLTQSHAAYQRASQLEPSNAEYAEAAKSSD